MYAWCIKTYDWCDCDLGVDLFEYFASFSIKNITIIRHIQHLYLCKGSNTALKKYNLGKVCKYYNFSKILQIDLWEG